MYSKPINTKYNILNMALNKTSSNRYEKTIQSISIWFIDKIKNNKDAEPSPLKYLLYFYFFCILGFSIVAIDTLVRVFLKKRLGVTNSKKLFDFAYVSFADSHESVLARIKNQCQVKSYSSVNISARPLRELFLKRYGVEFIDDFVSLPNFLLQIKNSISFLKFGRHPTNDFLKLTGKNISAFDHMIFFIKIFHSIRFEIWSNSFFDVNSINYMFLGNDTCYRAFWLIKNQNVGKSITIQHGIPENIFLYYSIADYFAYWDTISYNKLYKNSNVKYIKGGYPKENLNLCDSLPNQVRVMAICTKFKSPEELISIEKLATILKSNNFNFEIKFHPLETSANIKRLSNIKIFSDAIKYIGKFEYVIVIDSTFAIDLLMSKKSVIPASFNNNNSFSEYFNPINIRAMLTQIENLDYNEIKIKFDSMRVHEFNIEYLKFKITGNEISINDTII